MLKRTARNGFCAAAEAAPAPPVMANHAEIILSTPTNRAPATMSAPNISPFSPSAPVNPSRMGPISCMTPDRIGMIASATDSVSKARSPMIGIMGNSASMKPGSSSAMLVMTGPSS